MTPEGTVVSIFDGTTEYLVGARLRAKREAGGWAPLACCYFAHSAPKGAGPPFLPAFSLLHSPAAYASSFPCSYLHAGHSQRPLICCCTCDCVCQALNAAFPATSALLHAPRVRPQPAARPARPPGATCAQHALR